MSRGLARSRLRAAPARRSQQKPRFEGLEDRLLLASDLVAQRVTAISPTEVRVDYAVTGSIDEPTASLAVYRSADPQFDAADTLVGQTTLAGVGLSAGVHNVSITLEEPLDIRPVQPYVLAVLDPAGQIAEIGADAEANNTAAFRKWVVAAVTHGVELDGAFPAWVPRLATALNAQGYDVAIPFDWSQASNLPAPVTGQVAQALAGAVGQAIAALPLAPQDVVDVHLIGHSRGGGLVTQAAALLPTDAPPLQGGFLKLTLLDPHPTHNVVGVPYYSSSSGPIGTLTEFLFVTFQALANDPPLTIPASADGVEIFYQQTPVTQAITFDEQVINSWGEVPAGGATHAVAYFDVTAQTRSHYGVDDWYLQAVVPGLSTGGAVPVPSVPAPTPPTNGGPAFATPRQGYAYELAQFAESGVRRPLATHVLNGFSTLNRQLLAGRVRPVLHQVDRLNRLLLTRRGRGLPAPETDALLGGLARLRALLEARSPAPASPASPSSSPFARR